MVLNAPAARARGLPSVEMVQVHVVLAAAWALVETADLSTC